MMNEIMIRWDQLDLDRLNLIRSPFLKGFCKEGMRMDQIDQNTLINRNGVYLDFFSFKYFEVEIIGKKRIVSDFGFFDPFLKSLFLMGYFKGMEYLKGKDILKFGQFLIKQNTLMNNVKK